MDFNKIIKQIKFGLQNELPGADAQLLMAPEFRSDELRKYKPNNSTRKSAILIPLFEKDNEVYTLMTKRSMMLKNHPGQISFPGGGVDKSDVSYEDAALREANEELGIMKNEVNVIGRLSSLYIPPSNFIVYPFVGIIKENIKIKANPSEVDSVLEIPFNLFLNKDEIETFEFKGSSGLKRISPCYYWQGECIWGASAMIISELREVINDY